MTDRPDPMYRCPNLRGGTENMFCVLACQHGYTVAGEDGYARTYDEDDGILIRVGDVRAVLDVATMSMDFGSGFLDEEQVEALRKVAELLGLDPKVATPHNFVCKYGGDHQWQPMTLLNQTPALQATDAPELLERLRAAKAGDDPVELRAAKEAVQASRTARREENSPWMQPANSPRRPMDICPLCHHTRVAPAVWSSGSGLYTLELVIALQPRYATDDPGPLLDGILTLYEALPDELGEVVIDQRRVAVGNTDDPDDRLTWILWGTDRLALSQPDQPLVTWVSPPPRSPDAG